MLTIASSSPTAESDGDSESDPQLLNFPRGDTVLGPAILARPSSLAESFIGTVETFDIIGGMIMFSC